MGELIFVVGGAGSGKSRFAISVVGSSQKNVLFVATCNPQDSEMALKVEKHKEERPPVWQTLELYDTPFTTEWNGHKPAKILLLDSITIWVSTLLFRGLDRGKILKQCENFMTDIRNRFKKSVIVSDETGLGIVPENSLARNFRETLGQVNQQIANVSQETYLVVAGIAIPIKHASIKEK